MNPKIPSAITITSNGGLLRAIQGDCHICPGYDAGTVPLHLRPATEKFNAIWDTGATGSVITQEVVDRCGLKPTGIQQMHTANGVRPSETFLVNITLANGVMFMNVNVALADLPPGTHALIGMDIITIGDFSITNVGGKTVMSFRTPSMVSIDYVAEIRRKQALSQPKFQPGPPRKKRKF